MIGEIQYQIFGKIPRISCRSIWTSQERLRGFSTAGDPLTAFSALLSSGYVHENRFAFARQIHAATVRYVIRPGIQERCDGLYTTEGNLNLVIRTADCAAVMMYIPDGELVVNLHVGWRGAYAGIIFHGLDQIQSEYNIIPPHLVVAVSPCIHRCCYEVGHEFYGFFAENFIHESQGKYFFDLPAVIHQQLHQAGIREDNLEISEHCTVCSALQIPSYRRDRTENRLLNLIEIKDI